MNDHRFKKRRHFSDSRMLINIQKNYIISMNWFVNVWSGVLKKCGMCKCDLNIYVENVCSIVY